MKAASWSVLCRRLHGQDVCKLVCSGWFWVWFDCDLELVLLTTGG